MKSIVKNPAVFIQLELQNLDNIGQPLSTYTPESIVLVSERMWSTTTIKYNDALTLMTSNVSENDVFKLHDFLIIGQANNITLCIIFLGLFYSMRGRI